MSTLSGSPTKPRSTTSSTSPPPPRARDLARDHHVAVLAAQADRAAALRVDRADDLLVDRARQHHFDDLHRRLVGDAQAGGELRLDAELGEHRADLRPAAVDDHRIDAGLLEQDHVAGEIAPGRVVAHRVAAVFHHDRRVVVAQHVRQRLHQDFGLLLRAGAGRVCHGLSGGSVRRRSSSGWRGQCQTGEWVCWAGRAALTKLARCSRSFVGASRCA